jgi:hypothetical protein
MKGFSLFQEWKEQWRQRERTAWQRCSIHFDADSVVITDLRDPEREPVHWQWVEVERLILFKCDLLTTDSICLRVDLADDCWIALDEEMEGWNALVEALPRHLRGCQRLDQWFSQVAFPAFATNETEIYRRETATDARV